MPDARPGSDPRPASWLQPLIRRGAHPLRPSSGEGTRHSQRGPGYRARQTVDRLLEAGLAEFGAKGYHAVRVDDVVRRARISHGTFYLYFASKEDLFRALLHDALYDMGMIADSFPVVTPDDAGRAALRAWVRRFCAIYAAHAPVIRILSQAHSVGQDVWRDGLRLLFRLAEAITQGMTAASPGERGPAARGPSPEHAELTAVACLVMLERVNYVLSVDARLPRAEMAERLSAIVYTAFRAS